jgi:SAM-dependent methyltransferase
MNSSTPQRYISAACEKDLVRHGDSFRGVGYTKTQADAEAQYALMLDVIREEQDSVSVLDLGCGLGHMLDHINRNPKRHNVQYCGLDISIKYLDTARARHPRADFVLMDVLESDAGLSNYDYVIMNGLFNYRGEISEEKMLSYWQQMITIAYRHCRRGIAFNVMSKIVDWERDDLFHLPFDAMARFVAANLSRHFVIRHDYPAYEYTTYVYRSPNPS